MKIPSKMQYKQNLVCLCVDAGTKQEVQGRIYHGYNDNAIVFCTVMGVVGEMEKLFENIRYPQSTVHIRNFVEEQPPVRGDRAERVMSNEQVLAQRGEWGTFLITVESRQNASWQGELYWIEGEQLQTFDSEIKLFTLIYSALSCKK